MSVTKYLMCTIVLLANTVNSGADDKVKTKDKIPDNAEEIQVPLPPSRYLETVVDSAYLYRIEGETIGERWFYESGQLAYERMLMKNDVPHGKARWFYPNGKIYWCKSYENGLLDGDCIYWTNDGKEIGRSKMRKGSGLLKEYRPDGSLEESCHYQNGKRHGIRTNQSHYGRKIISYENYENDKTEGWSRAYTPDGVLVGEMMHQGGKLHGVWRDWNRLGVLINGTPKYYINSEEVSEEEFVEKSKNDRTLYRSLHSISNRQD